MVRRFLIDSSAVSKYIDGRFSESGLLFLDHCLIEAPNISVITKIELLSWVTDEKEVFKQIEIFVEDSNLFDLSAPIIEKTILLRRKYKIKTPDAIIAATALCHDMSLVTDNERDFINIKGLKVINPNTVK